MVSPASEVGDILEEPQHEESLPEDSVDLSKELGI